MMNTRSFRVLITRPKTDAKSLALLLAKRGVDSIQEPLLVIENVTGPPLKLDGVQALLMTSVNGVRAFIARDGRRHLPVFGVGKATAQAAKEAGFKTVVSASGDVDSLVKQGRSRLKPEAGDLLHIAGSQLAGDLAGQLEAAGFTCRRQVLYGAQVVETLSSRTEKIMREGRVDGVLFYSPRTAATFVDLVRQAGLEDTCAGMIAFCLSPAVADRVSVLEWKDLAVAGRPEQTALVDMVFARA